MSDGTLLFDTKLDTSGLQSGLGKIGGVLGTGLKVAAAATTAVASGLAAAGAASVKVGADFETSMAKTETLFTGTAEEFKQLSDDILSISSATGQSAQELAEAAYSAESAGVAQKDLATMLEASSKLAAAGFTDVDTALSATAKTMNAYGDSAGSIEEIQKVLIQTQNLGITTVGELGASLAQVTPTAAAMGVSFDQVGASLAVMTAAGTPTAQATTQLNTLIAELAKNGTTASNNLAAAAEGTQYAGMSFTEMMEAGVPLNEVLGLMSTYASESGVSMIDMFSSIEAGKASLAIFGEDGSKFAETLAQMGTSADVVNDGFETMTDTLEAKVGILKETTKNFGISIYENMQAPLMEFADIGIESLNKIAEGFRNNGIDGAMEAAGEAISGLLAKIIDYIPEFLNAAMKLMGALGQGIKDNLPQILEAAQEIIYTLIQGLIDSLPSIIETALEIIITLAKGLGEALPELIPAVVEIIMTIIETLIEHLPEIIEAAFEIAIGIFTGLVNAIPRIIEAIPKIIVALVTALIESIPKIVEAGFKLFVSLISSLPEIIVSIVAAVPQIIAGLVKAFASMFGKMADVGKDLMQNVKDGILSMLSKIGSAVFEIGKNIVQGLWNGLKSAWSWLTDGVSNLIGGLVGGITSFLGIASPSKKFKWIGEMCVAGFDEGTEDLGNIDGFGQAINASLGTINANTSGAGAGANGSQTFNFYDTQTSPDAIRRKVQNTMTFGLAGGI